MKAHSGLQELIDKNEELCAEVEARRASEALLAASLRRLDADLAVVCARESQALDEYAKHRRELEAEAERLRSALTAIKQAFANRCCGALKWNALWDVAEDMAVMAEAALGPHVRQSP